MLLSQYFLDILIKSIQKSLETDFKTLQAKGLQNIGSQSLGRPGIELCSLKEQQFTV